MKNKHSVNTIQFELVDDIKSKSEEKKIKPLPIGSSDNVVVDERKYFSYGEVSKHNTNDDAWIIINGFVLDITKFIKFHPGGVKVLLKNIGKDGSGVFKKVAAHDERYIEKYIIGVISETKQDNIEKYENPIKASNIFKDEYQSFQELYYKHLDYCKSKYKWLFSVGISQRIKLFVEEIIANENGYMMLYRDYLFLLFKPKEQDQKIQCLYEEHEDQIKDLNIYRCYEIIYLKKEVQKIFEFTYTTNANIKKSRQINNLCYIATLRGS